MCTPKLWLVCLYSRIVWRAQGFQNPVPELIFGDRGIPEGTWIRNRVSCFWMTVGLHSKIVSGGFVLQNSVTCRGFAKPHPRRDFRGPRNPRSNRGFLLQDCVRSVRAPELRDVPRVYKTPTPNGFSGTAEVSPRERESETGFLAPTTWQKTKVHFCSNKPESKFSPRTRAKSTNFDFNTVKNMTENVRIVCIKPLEHVWNTFINFKNWSSSGFLIFIQKIKWSTTFKLAY